MMKAAKIPLISAEVTKDWLKTALSPDSPDVTVHDLYQYKSKDGVLSSIFKAQVTLQDGLETKNLFIKVMPEPDVPQRVFIEKNAIDAIELKTYEVSQSNNTKVIYLGIVHLYKLT
jgi:hypothetical protein